MPGAIRFAQQMLPLTVSEGHELREGRLMRSRDKEM